MDLDPAPLAAREPALTAPDHSAPLALALGAGRPAELVVEAQPLALQPYAAAFNEGFADPASAYARFSDQALADPATPDGTAGVPVPAMRPTAVDLLPRLGDVRDGGMVSALQSTLRADVPGAEAVRAGALSPALQVQERLVLGRDLDDVVPIAFPDYEISVAGYKVPQLGHAGVLLIDDETGLTKYYEYGRYDAAGLGEVRQRPVPNVEIDPATSRPTQASMDRVLASISRQAGQSGDIRAAYIDNAADFDDMHAYAEGREALNGDPSRTPYALFSNSCNTFMRDVAVAGGVDMPWIIDPRPTGYIGRVRGDFLDLDYDASTGTSTVRP